MQSTVMYRTGKPLHGCSNHFVLYPFIIYVALTTLLLAAEGAQAPPSQRDIKEAEKIVGGFLRNEAGGTWLLGLAKTKSAPLTSQDLMNEILKATRPGGKVWEAASILGKSLKDQTRNGNNAESVLGQAENWKDLVSHIENQDDIICLYRKNTVETAKKADDWKKFLRTVSPGYTVHLAIDTGRKYVICLKKIDEIFITKGPLSTRAASSSSDPPVLSAEMTFPTTPGKVDILSASGIRKNANNTESDAMPAESDENCDDEDSGSTKDHRDDDSNYNIDDRKVEDKYDLKKLQRGMQDDLSTEFEDYPVNTQRQLYLGSSGRSLVNSPVGIPGGDNHKSFQNSQCNRPIILVMQNGNRPGSPLEIPIQRNLKSAQSPWFPPHFGQFQKMPGPMHPPRIPGSVPLKPLGLHINSPPLPIADVKTTVYKPGTREMLLKNIHLINQTPRRKMRMPEPVPKLVKSIVQPVAITIAKPVERTARNNFHRQRPNFPGFRNSLIRESPKPTRWKVEPNNNYNRQSKLAKTRNLYHLPEFSPNDTRSSPVPSPAPRSFLPLTNIRAPSRSSFIMDRELFRQSSSPYFQGTNQKNQRPYLNFYTNYPATKYFIQPETLAWTPPPPPPPPLSIRSSINSLGHPPTPTSAPLVCPLAGYLTARNSVPCRSSCDIPVKLQILINGNVQEPLKVSVISEPGQSIEIVGSDNPIKPYGSRALSEGFPSVRDLGDEEENILSKDSQVRIRMKESEESSEKDADNENKEEQHISATEFMEQITTAIVPETRGTESSEIGEKFRHESSVETTSQDSVIEVKSTGSEITNSTIPE